MFCSQFHHALTVDTKSCIGCSHCMRVCPTEAIRVFDGKAEINPQRCVDCGECQRVCPASAIIVEEDDFNDIFNYEHSVALVPSVLMGQFADEVTTSQIYQAIYDLGFKHVYEVEHGVEFLSEITNEYIQNHPENKPLISSYCPAIIRLIQVRFPALIDNIIKLKSPVDIAATYYKKHLLDKGVENQEIGMFYITPCASKIASIKSSVDGKKSEIAGVINQDSLYGRIIKQVSKNSEKKIEKIKTQLTEKGILWSLTNGESKHAEGRSIAVDGIMNSIDFLERLENEEIKGIDFIELRACDESCAGGILNVNNRFLTAERMRTRAKKYSDRINENESENVKKLDDYKDYLVNHIQVEGIKPRMAMHLDNDMSKAMEKMMKTRKMMCHLPGFDCGACGAPSCKALAEDIAQTNATLSHCIFMQRIMEKHHKLSGDHAFRIIEKIWGKDRLDKDCNRKGAVNDSFRDS